MQIKDQMELPEEIAKAFDACLSDTLSKALSARATAAPSIGQDLFEQMAQQLRDDRHLQLDDERPAVRRRGTAASREAIADVIDVPFRDVVEPPRQA